MSIHVALNHVTHCLYDRRVGLSPHVVRLRPAPHSRARILSCSMSIGPARNFINWQQDPESTYLAHVAFSDKSGQPPIEVDLIAETSGLLLGEGHIPLVCTPEPPAPGAVEKCLVELEHTLRVDRVWEEARVTKPYQEAQWTQIQLLARATDQDLVTLDVRRT